MKTATEIRAEIEWLNRRLAEIGQHPDRATPELTRRLAWFRGRIDALTWALAEVMTWSPEHAADAVGYNDFRAPCSPESPHA